MPIVINYKSTTYRLPNDLLREIDLISEGNKTALVISLLRQSLEMRKIPENSREKMYVAGKKARRDLGEIDCPYFSRTMINALNI